MWCHTIKPNCGTWTSFLILLKPEGIQSTLAQIHLHFREDSSKSWSLLPWEPKCLTLKMSLPCISQHPLLFHLSSCPIYVQVQLVSILLHLLSFISFCQNQHFYTRKNCDTPMTEILWKSGLGGRTHYMLAVISQLFGIQLCLWISCSQNNCVFIAGVPKLAVPLPSSYSFCDFGSATWCHVELTRTLENTEDKLQSH